jgi:hypothetical protein
MPPARPESASVQAARVLYVALLGAIEAGLVRTMEDAVTVLRQASKPLGLMGDDWLKLQERLLRGQGDAELTQGPMPRNATTASVADQSPDVPVSAGYS